MPTPIRYERQQDPGWLAHGPGDMGGNTIDTDHQIQLGNGVGKIGRIFDLWLKVCNQRGAT